MMFLDTDDIIKWVSGVTATLVVAGAVGAAVWYNSNLKSEFDEGKTETVNLRQETSRLGATTDEIRSVVDTRSKELAGSISASRDDTKRVEGEVKQQGGALSSLQQEHERNRRETAQQLSQLSQGADALRGEVAKLRAEHERYRTESQADIAKLRDSGNALRQQLQSKDQEIAELKDKLDKEIAQRTRSGWGR